MALTEDQERSRFAAYSRVSRTGGPVPTANYGEILVGLNGAQMPRMMPNPGILLPASVVVVPSDASDEVMDAARITKLKYGSNVLICDGDEDDVELNASLEAGDNVQWLPGDYSTSASINPKTEVKINCAGVNIIPDTDTFPAIEVTDSSDRWEFTGPFKVNYGVATGGTRSTNSNAVGVKISGTEMQNHFKIEGMLVGYSYRGVDITTQAHQYCLKDIMVQEVYDCGIYIYSTVQTGVRLDNCWVVYGSNHGFYLRNINNLFIGPCEANNTAIPYTILSCNGNGIACNQESNTIPNGGAVFNVSGKVAFVGCNGYNNKLTGNNYSWIYRVTNGGQLTLINCGDSSNNFDGVGTYGVFSLTNDGSTVTTIGSEFTEISGSGGGTGKLYFDTTSENNVSMIDSKGSHKTHTIKIIKSHDSNLFNAAGLTDSENIWTQPAGSTLLECKAVLNEQFVATSMTDLGVVLGLAGDNDGLLQFVGNLTSDSVNTNYKTKGDYWNGAGAQYGNYYSHTATTWVAYATAVGANLDTTSAGQITFYFTYRDV